METLASALQKNQTILGPNYEKLGKWNGLSRKVYLTFDAKKGWKVERYNLFQVFVRALFGCFKQSHSAIVAAQLQKEGNLSSIPNYEALLAHFKLRKKTVGPNSKADLCIHCHIRPKYFPHDYCGKTCARKAAEAKSGISTQNHKAKIDHSPVLFYNNDQPFYEFTNFYASPFKHNGITYPSVEIAFQSLKFGNSHVAKKIAKMTNPRQAFEEARKPENQQYMNPNWHNGVKDQLMYELVKAKFSQNAKLRAKLLSTGVRRIVEHSDKDNYWGDGCSNSYNKTIGPGKNMLGQILMKVRSEIQQGSR